MKCTRAVHIVSTAQSSILPRLCLPARPRINASPFLVWCSTMSMASSSSNWEAKVDALVASASDGKGLVQIVDKVGRASVQSFMGRHKIILCSPCFSREPSPMITTNCMIKVHIHYIAVAKV